MTARTACDLSFPAGSRTEEQHLTPQREGNFGVLQWPTKCYACYEQHLVTRKPLPSETTAYVAAVTPLLDNEQGEHAAADGRRALPWRKAPLFVERAGAPGRTFGLHSKRCNTIMTLRLSGLLRQDPRSRGRGVRY
jgi:hypothetical protein